MQHRQVSAWRWVSAILVLVWLVSTPALAQQAFAGFEGSVVRFAGVEEGRRVLMANDDYIEATSELQRGAMIEEGTPPTREALRLFHHGVVQAWPSDREAHWRNLLGRIAQRFNALRLRLPKEVVFINTDGREMDNSPYTRAHAVVLPHAGTFPKGVYTDEELLAHELFHVVSRHDPALATRLYATLGFEPAEPLQWPAEWLSVRFANPDAPYDRHLMRTRIDYRDVVVMPVVVASRTKLNRSKGESSSMVLDTRLLEVEPGKDGAQTVPVLRDGQLAWHAPGAAKNYLARMGGNTSYMLHPEETMADNIAFLVSGREVPNPALLQRIKAVLLGEATP